MNFSWKAENINHINQNIGLIDVQSKFRELTEEFTNYYYSTYDNNFPELKGIYTPESLFTYLDEEFTGFDQLFNRIKQYDIYRFTHHSLNINAQPVGERTILINVNGTISVNSSCNIQKFTETILLQRDDTNHFSVYHTIFRLID